MRRGPLAVAVAGVVVALLAVAQAVLPGVAARRLSSDLARRGRDVRVEVRAFPAIKLLWHRADRVTVRVGAYRPGSTGSGRSLPDQLAGTRDTGDLDVRVGRLDEGPLRMHDVTLRKSGDVLVGQVRLVRGELDAALPSRLRVAAHALPGGGLRVAGETSAFGPHIAARARIVVDGSGRIVLRPEGIPLASLVSVAVFSDRRVAVDALTARATGDGFRVTARGHLR